MTRRELLRLAGAAVGTGFVTPRPVRAQRRAGPDGLDALADRLPRTVNQIRSAVLERGGQLYVSLEGRVIADVAWGRAPGGAAFEPRTLVSWASAVKPATCTCLMKLWERGRLDLDDPVTRFIPGFGVNGKDAVRVRHLLTHTAHLGGYAGPQQLDPRFADTIARIVQAPRLPARGPSGIGVQPPGTASGYNPAGIWIVAEICRRLYDRPFEDVIRREVFEPCGMSESWCGMPLARYRAYKSAGLFASGYLDSESDIVKSQPAGGGIGPTRELAAFYEMVLNRGVINGRRLLTPQTVEAMTTPKSPVGTMGIWGLGFNLAIPPGVTVPETAQGERVRDRFGSHASPRAFGHPGASGMQAFADPEHGLVATFIGRPALHDAIYEDLRLI